MGAAILANRICGYTPSMAKVLEPGQETLMTFLPARVVHNDLLAKKNLERVEQAVLMGAGFDLRLLELSRGTDVEVFELDMEKTQQLKLATMKAAGIAHNHVTYVPIDFRNEDWVEKLVEAGFDKTKTTYFHWESVNPYLEEDVALETLRRMRRTVRQRKRRGAGLLLYDPPHRRGWRRLLEHRAHGGEDG